MIERCTLNAVRVGLSPARPSIKICQLKAKWSSRMIVNHVTNGFESRGLAHFIHLKYGPVVYWLGYESFNLMERVRFPSGLKKYTCR